MPRDWDISYSAHENLIYRDEMELQSRGYICANLHQSRVGMLGDPILVRLNCSNTLHACGSIVTSEA